MRMRKERLLTARWHEAARRLRHLAVFLGLLPVVSTSSARAGDDQSHRWTNVGLGVNRRQADGTLTSAFNLGIFNNADSLRGFQLGLFSASVRRDMQGASIGGLIAHTKGSTHGLHASLVVNGVEGHMRGVQLSAVSNIANSLQGVQLSGFANVARHATRGIQLSAITNIAMGMHLGTQVSAMANINAGSMRGLQIGGYNYTDTLTGSQIGIVNVAGTHPKGVQIGLFNYSSDTLARKVGLVNISPLTQMDILTFFGSTSRFNAALRFRNRSTYSIIGFGTHYMGLDEKFSGALYYRIGQYFRLRPRWTLGGDVGYYHIETFQRNSTTKPERLYSLQAHLNLDYQINRSLGVFASVGYGDTRYYGHNREYKNGLIGQVGLSVRWKRHSQAGLPQLLPADADAKDSAGNVALWNNGRKNYWRAVAEATGINAFVHCFDRFVLNEDFAQVHFKDIAHNWRHAFVWDNDQFSTNLFAHPYHGNLYFNSARSNGLTFWQSTPFALGGSLMWEFCGEVEPPAINDVFATTFGGIAIGEVMHRVSELILDDRAHGFRRFLREAAATVVNPMGGLNRIIDGDAWRVRHDRYRYYDRERLPIDFSVSTGTRYLSDDGALFRGEFNPYVNIYLEYGDPLSEENSQPYDYFYAETTFGLSANQPIINRLHLLGRIWGKHVDTHNGEAEVGIYQHFNYYDSKPVKNGTSLTPYRISEAAAFGPGIIMRFPQAGALTKLEQRLFLSGIILGGTKSDYYNIIDRDYNMGSGFSVKTKTHMELRNFGRFILHANYFRIFTWKGYEDKDLSKVNPLYLNAQGDRGNAELLVVNPMWEIDFKGPLSVVVGSSYFYRNTRYKYHKDVHAKTFELQAGITYHF